MINYGGKCDNVHNQKTKIPDMPLKLLFSNCENKEILVIHIK